MRVRAISDMCQLRDADFFVAVSRGLELVVRNAQELAADGDDLAEAGRRRAAAILAGLAGEEASKFFILLDAVRCPRGSDTFARQLARFNDHLAKALYATCYAASPATVGETRTFVDLQREEFYLDGPNGVEWIFPNQLLFWREQRLYVDYVATDEAHEWMSPSRYAAVGIPVPHPFVLDTASGRRMRHPPR